MAPRAETMSSAALVSSQELGYEPQTLSPENWPAADHYPAPLIDTRQKKRGTERRRRRTITVNFCPTTITHTVEHLDDLPATDIWYTQEEYSEIKQRNADIIRLIKSGQFMETCELSCRGLEHKLKEVFRQRRANKFEALNAVMEEQDRQISRGAHEPKKISSAYLVVSVRCQEAANTVALRDYRFSYCYSPEKPAGGYPPKTSSPKAKSKSSRGMSPKSKKDKGSSKLKKSHMIPNDDDVSVASTVNNEEKKKKGARKILSNAKAKMMRRMSM